MKLFFTDYLMLFIYFCFLHCSTIDYFEHKIVSVFLLKWEIPYY